MCNFLVDTNLVLHIQVARMEWAEKGTFYLLLGWQSKFISKHRWAVGCFSTQTFSHIIYRNFSQILATGQLSWGKVFSISLSVFRALYTETERGYIGTI